MKYRHKLTILLVVTALVPMTVLALYGHSRQSAMVRSSDLEDMQSIIEQTKESIDSQTRCLQQSFELSYIFAGY